MTFIKRTSGLAAALVIVGSLGVAAAAGTGVFTRGAGPNPAMLRCPGGMSRLGHEFNEQMSLFAFDPAVRISDEYTVAEDFFLVEDIDTGSHAGTHLDVPAHFIGEGRTVDELAASEFVWPVYKIDVRGRTFADNFVEIADIKAYEAEHGKIPAGGLVVLQTGAEEFWGAEEVVIDEEGNSANVDDFFDFENPGFSGVAVQWLFDERGIDGVGSDAYGPDAFGDELFDATFTTLANDGVALVALANLDSINVRGDIILAPTIALSDGSGFTTDPLACHGGGVGRGNR
ncbi:MAG: cyclase family protein [Acidimicrobiia bacterium]|nr:cyclase family protein [Acidimicrobiia bacterium]